MDNSERINLISEFGELIKELCQLKLFHGIPLKIKKIVISKASLNFFSYSMEIKRLSLLDYLVIAAYFSVVIVVLLVVSAFLPTKFSLDG